MRQLSAIVVRNNAELESDFYFATLHATVVLDTLQQLRAQGFKMRARKVCSFT